MTLPIFKYHPDPVSTEVVVESEKECICCKLVRGYVYTGPIYSEGEYDECICPWCIADGSAHQTLGVLFHDQKSFGMSGDCDSEEVSAHIIEEVCFRTPGFSGWQQERWYVCCGDVAAFLGSAGHEELISLWPDAIEAIRESTGLEGTKWNKFFKTLDRYDAPTAYVFRCLHCGRYGGYQDVD